MPLYEWSASAPGYLASGTDVEPVAVLHRTGCAVLKGGEKAQGVIRRDGRVWRTLKYLDAARVVVVKLDGTEVEVTPYAGMFST